MPTPPECRSLGRHCREVKLTIRISDATGESQTLKDASVTWITGHTERVTYGKAYVAEDEIRTEAIVHVPCKYLRTTDGDLAIAPDGTEVCGRDGNGTEVHCAIHGFRGAVPQSTQQRGESRHDVRLPDGRFALYYKGKRRTMDLRLKRAARRALPVVQGDNPCATAPCFTGDNKRGAACCRDYDLELALPKTQVFNEALLRARTSPYLCKVKREDDDNMECEVITACGYLDDDGITCVLHDRTLPNGQRAKPSLCYEWPKLEEDETGHGGCVLL
jgi:hypothetical protein